MTVQELINELLKIEDKTKIVESYCGCPGILYSSEVEEIQEEKDAVVIY